MDMRLIGIGIALLALAGCSNPAEDAEDQYNIVAASGPSDQKCEAAKRVRDAWLREKNQHLYATWQLRARIDCTSAQMDIQEQMLAPDDMANMQAAPER